MITPAALLISWGAVLATTTSADEWADAQPAEATPITEESTWFGDAFPEIDRTLNLHTARTARPGSWLFVVQHRATVPIGRDPLYNTIGLDGGNMKVGIGTRFGIVDGLDAGVSHHFKTSFEKFGIYEVDVRWRFLRATPLDLNVAARGGLTWFLGPMVPSRDAAKNQKAGGFAQLMADAIFFERLLVGLQAGFVSRSHNDTKVSTDTPWSVGLALAAELRIIGNFAWTLEAATGVGGYVSKYPTFCTGPKIITNRHTFSVVLTNSSYMSAESIFTNTDRAWKDVVFGFNISRELGP